MLDHTEEMDLLMQRFRSFRAKRNTLLAQRQIISVLDTELFTLGLELGNLSSLQYTPEFTDQHLKIQSDMDKTAKLWFG